MPVRNWIVASAVAAVFGSALLASPAGAAPVEPLSGLSSLNDIQQAQFYFGGRRYCWYDSAWRGPGFYWCGYAWRRGYGWGGGYGWRGWHAGRRYGRGYRYGHGYRGGHVTAHGGHFHGGGHHR
jgi:hypothetical protein